MNTAELTALLNEDRAARLMANIARRAARLFSDGYVSTPTMSGLFVQSFQVVSPEGKRYTVKVSKTNAEPGTFFGDKCSCPCFEGHKTCKHLQALAMQAAQEEAQCEAYDALQAEGGFDVDEYEFANFCGEGRN